MAAKIQCDASDKREIVLPSGTKLVTTNYAADEFMVLATSLQPFTGDWQFGFRLNKTLERSSYHAYSEEVRQHILKTLVPIEFPVPTTLDSGNPWTTDLFALLRSDPDVGELLSEGSAEQPYVAQTRSGDEIVRDATGDATIVMETPDADEL